MEKITLIDTRGDSGYDYESYIEYCKYNDIEPKAENSDEFWEYVSLCKNTDYEDLFVNLHSATDKSVVIQGELGFWNGKREIVPVLKMGDSTDTALACAIKKCLKNSDLEDFSIVLEDGIIKVYGYHHDGTHSFNICPLSSEGEEYVVRKGIGDDDLIEDFKDNMVGKFEEKDLF